MDQPRSYLRWCADFSPCSFCTRKLTLMLMSFSVMSVTLLWAILAAFAGTIPCKTKHRTAQKIKNQLAVDSRVADHHRCAYLYMHNILPRA